MRVQRSFGFLSALVACVAVAAPVVAQQGTLSGRVTDAESGRPIEAAQVQVVRGSGSGGLSDATGSYRLQLAPGTYSIVVQYVGYQTERFDGIRVNAGQNTVFDVSLTSTALALEGITITASRGTPEKSTEAPATTHSISALEISERPVTATVDYLKSAPGVDVVSYGLQGSNVVVRGFNNIFSGALHMLTDHRLAGVPSLRVNLMHFIPSNQEDIDRMEVVLGPGSALYGPNTANGVVHILTKSPLDDQGTTVTLGGGERNVLTGSFRSAFLLGDDFGFKISGEYLSGDEWEFQDPTEEANRLSAAQNPQLCIADRMLRGITQAEAQTACARVGIRNYDLERYSFEARADYRFAEDGTFVGTYGRNNSSGIELTGLGAGQTVDWVYEFYQARFNKGRFFAQAYVNSSDAGDSYLLNTGIRLVDKSKLYVAQAQHGFGLADGAQDFTYGFDYIATRPATEGNINGIYEDDDSMNEWGAYLQSKTALGEKADLILAGRLDNHSILADNVFSPRAALVIKPTEESSLRFSYNQAYSSPSSLNYFLDIQNGFAPNLASLGFGLRAFGTGRDGWALTDASGAPLGFRSPFNPQGPGTLLPMGAAANFWGATIQVLQAQVAAGALPASLGALLPILGGLSPTAADIGASLFHPVDSDVPVPVDQYSGLRDVPSIQESNTETFEFGWTGIVADRVKITGDVYYTKKNNFVSPLLVQTPLVMLNGADVGAYLQQTIGALLVQQGLGAGLSLEQAQAQAGATITSLATGIAQIPVGVVSNSEFPGGADLIVTYRNVGDLTLWGGDLAFQWFLDDHWTMDATYSYVSDDLFPVVDDLGNAAAPIALNSPQHKGSFALSYRDLNAGFNAQARFRFNSSFPAISAGFDGTAPENKVVDVNLGYRVPSTSATLQLAVNNIFDADYYSFVGVPRIGRMAMVRVKYDLF